MLRNSLTRLQERSPVLFSAWCIIAAFGTYFCMYGFRKPFTAGSYGGELEKTALVTAQVFGYTLSKFIGVKVVSELPAQKRIPALLLLIGVAEVALCLFGLLPYPYNLLAIFMNGLPLGMVFGLVLRVLEGRRQTDALAAGLCASFILAGGVTKTVGTWLLKTVNIPEPWMPATAGLVYLLPLVFFALMLAQIPVPTQTDQQDRQERVPMNHEERMKFLNRYKGGIVLITFAYLLLTILRSVRDDFAPEIWKGLGQKAAPEIFTQTEMWVTLGVVFFTGMIVAVRDNKKAFVLGTLISLGGFILAGVAALLQGVNAISGFVFMTLVGLGLYLPYVIVQSMLFERFIAMAKERGNIGFLVYLADSIGYLGYVVVMLLKSTKVLNTSSTNGNFAEFFRMGTLGIAVLGAVALAIGGKNALASIARKNAPHYWGAGGGIK
jgi:hypothetical protein